MMNNKYLNSEKIISKMAVKARINIVIGVLLTFNKKLSQMLRSIIKK